jgi:hypothetical protein
MTVRLARTRHEANLFIDVTPCVCGESQLPRSSSAITLPGGMPGVRYAGTCPHCGRERVFEFQAPEVPQDFPADDEVIFGRGTKPSELLDVGQWVAVAQAYAGAVPAAAASLRGEERTLARLRLMAAVGAVQEALKFVDRTGLNPLSEAALWTDAGREVYARDPGLFKSFPLEGLQREYERRLRSTDGPEEFAKSRINPERVQRLRDETAIKRAWEARHGIGESMRPTPEQNAELEVELRRRRGLDVVTGASFKSAASGLRAFEILCTAVRRQWQSDPAEAKRRIDLAYAAYLAWRARHGIDDSAWAHVLMSDDPRTDAWSVRDQPLPPAELVWEMVRDARRAAGMTVGDE